MATPQRFARLSDYVKNGGHLVVAFKSGFCNEYSTVRWELMPGPLKAAAGFHYQEFSSLKQPLPLKDDPFHVGAENKVSEWAEMIVPDTAKALAYYDHPFFGQYPAITRNEFDKGSLTYEGTVLTENLQKAVLLGVLNEAGILSSDWKLPAGVHVKHAQIRQGKALHFYLNYSSAPQMVPYAYASGVNLLSQAAALIQGQSLLLQPWDAAIMEEK
ncbi:MAG: beta-galactosidase trimerization domain-containing protein [Candidatus Acidiferrum sp.]